MLSSFFDGFRFVTAGLKRFGVDSWQNEEISVERRNTGIKTFVSFHVHFSSFAPTVRCSFFFFVPHWGFRFSKDEITITLYRSRELLLCYVVPRHLVKLYSALLWSAAVLPSAAALEGVSCSQVDSAILRGRVGAWLVEVCCLWFTAVFFYIYLLSLCSVLVAVKRGIF